MTQQNGRFQVIEKLIPKKRSTLTGALILLAIVIGILRSASSGDMDWAVIADNLSTGLLGTAVAFYFIDLFQERRSELQLKRRLISQIRSGDKKRALHAIEELRLQGWLFDGSLQRKYFRGVCLEEGVDLRCANLANADWRDANLVKVRLHKANLQYVNFRKANLQDAILWKAELHGADLWKADLQGANLLHTKFDENTVLPDGTMWKPETDMKRFTDPDRPDYKPDESMNTKGDDQA